jgi:cyclopropane fatty-acyl-phospholipid synthase-like methyltransferase
MHAWQSPELTRNFLTGIRGILPLASEQLDVMLYVIRHALPDVTRILDVGSGSGVLSKVLLNRYPSAYTTLVDFSEPMLAAAREQFTEHQAAIYNRDLTTPAWLDAVQGNAPFDVVVSGYAIHHLTHERKQALYREIFGLLRPGGMFINVEHIASTDAWVEDLFNRSVADGIYASETMRGDATYEAILDRLSHQDDGDICATVEDQCAWLRDIGFEHVDCYMKIYALAVFGGIKP